MTDGEVWLIMMLRAWLVGISSVLAGSRPAIGASGKAANVAEPERLGYPDLAGRSMAAQRARVATTSRYSFETFRVPSVA